MADVVADKVCENFELLPTVTEAEDFVAYKQKNEVGLTNAQKKGLALHICKTMITITMSNLDLMNTTRSKPERIPKNSPTH